MVDVYGCLIGKVGVCLFILGLGVINLVIGVVDVDSDGVLVVVIIG